MGEIVTRTLVCVASVCALLLGGCSGEEMPPNNKKDDEGLKVMRVLDLEPCLAEVARDRACHFVVKQGEKHGGEDLGVWLGDGRTDEPNIMHVVEWIRPPAFVYEAARCASEQAWVREADLHPNEWVIGLYDGALGAGPMYYAPADRMTHQVAHAVSERRWDGTSFKCTELLRAEDVDAVPVTPQHSTPGPFRRDQLDLIVRP